MADTPLTVSELAELLGIPLEPVLSTDRSKVGIAKIVEHLSRDQQDFVIKWSTVVAKSNAELAYKFVENSAAAFNKMSMDTVHDWLIQAMDVYDKQGLYLAAKVIKNVEGFATFATEEASGITFDIVSGVLEKFIRGLSGRELKLARGDVTFTDTSTLFLPNVIRRFGEQADNYRLYKSLAAQLWAQTWYGTFHLNPVKELSRFDNLERATGIFCYLETTRLTNCIKRDLPGLFREMSALQGKCSGSKPDINWLPWLDRLAEKNTTVEITYQAVAALYATGAKLPDAYCFQPTVAPESVLSVMEQRIASDKARLQQVLANMVKDFTATREEGVENIQYDLERIEDETETSGFRFELTTADIPLTTTIDLKKLLESIYQDIGEIPADYLVAGGDGEYKPGGVETTGPVTTEDSSVIYYDEWDYRRQQYRKDWCWLKEKEILPNHEPFVANTVKKYYGLIMSIRKTFEALRGEDRLLKRQINGDDIDINAVVEGHADLLHGMEMPEKLFTRSSRLERNIAVMFMVDMSGSTKGWINEAEREALVLLCEALEILGDRYAIYGFSGLTRNRCEIYRIKMFNEVYSDEVQSRIAGITPGDYTRMGVTIRHLSRLLNAVEARTKLLITLSDGKPDDFDGYRGEYGIEDTRKALIEAKHMGIHPFCITIDNEAHGYLPHMYGPVNYVLLNNVRKLPLKIADIYRQLTH